MDYWYTKGYFNGQFWISCEFYKSKDQFFPLDEIRYTQVKKKLKYNQIYKEVSKKLPKYRSKSQQPNERESTSQESKKSGNDKNTRKKPLLTLKIQRNDIDEGNKVYIYISIEK